VVGVQSVINLATSSTAISHERKQLTFSEKPTTTIKRIQSG